MRLHQNGGRAKLGLTTVIVLVLSLIGTTGASAAPRDNLKNAGMCLRGSGWRTLQINKGHEFR